ncbi:winged helix-turn-helix transcriptional regulator [Nonomuraea sp. NPDC003707]
MALHKAGEHTRAELAELFGLTRSTVHRAVERAITGSDPSPTDRNSSA